MVLFSAALVMGAALLFSGRNKQPVPLQGTAAAPAPPAPVAPIAPVATVSTLLGDADKLSAADLALGLAAWPRATRLEELAVWVRHLAARGPAAIPSISAAMDTAATSTARSALADALAHIGTPDAVQALCVHASQTVDPAARESIASAFRALRQPASAAVLATVLSQTDDPIITKEAISAVQRLADTHAVLEIARLASEDGQLYSQRDAVLAIMQGLQNPECLPALDALAADESDAELQAAAAAARQRLMVR
jgi:HEAT repeat protein